MCFPFVFCHVLKTIPIIVFWRNHFLQVKVCYFSGLCFPFVNITSQYDHSPALFPKNTGRITLLRVIHSLANCFDQVSDISPESIYGIYTLTFHLCSFWQYLASILFWHPTWNLFWHSFWQSFSHSIWHLPYVLTFCLAVYGVRIQAWPTEPELAMWCSGPGVPSCIRSWQRRSRQQRGGGGGGGE